MHYDIEKLKGFESTVQCTERNLKIIRALLQKNKLTIFKICMIFT